MPAVIVVFEVESEFSLSFIEELGRCRILRYLYFNGMRDQRVKQRKSSPFDSPSSSMPIGAIYTKQRSRVIVRYIFRGKTKKTTKFHSELIRKMMNTTFKVFTH
ncbi:hypothetical protein AVEN_66562-1 [Araneus ventricosus]|uniref:Uncharacterized protein n=1 Tax=Araneus ventricosus TaxID=182803 RepID=A0A4Y2EII1_ARAVE|nr:hypothetical protein AVEN_66562-1 [Araneus ventricosus]